MLVPLILLAVLAVAGGWIGIPKALGGGDQFAHFLDPVINPTPSYEQTRIAMDEQGVQHAAASTPQAPGTDSQERCSARHRWSWLDRLVFCRSALPPQARAGRSAWSSASGAFIQCWCTSTGLTRSTTRSSLLRCSSLLATCCGVQSIAESINGGGSLAAGGVRGLGALVQRVQSGNIRSYAGWLAVGAAALLLITYFGFSMHL